MGSINGAALRAIREHQTPRITQEELAERVGISQGALSNLESGKRMGSPDVIRALALHLNVPIAAITYPHAECPNCAKAVA